MGVDECIVLSRAEKDKGKLPPNWQKCLLIGMLSIGLVACLTATVAYTLLKVVSSDLDTVLNNWEAKPIIDVIVVNKTTGNVCPEGYTSHELPSFNGATKGSCACSSNSVGYSSTYANCSDTVEAVAECSSDSALYSIDLLYWRRGKICIKTGGEAAYNFKTNKMASKENNMQPWRRPNPDKDTGECPSGYRKCGSGTFATSRAFCVATDTQCPYTSLKVAPYSSKSTLEGLGYSITGNGSLDNEYYLFGRRAYTNELPLVGGRRFLKAGLTSIGSSNYISSYDASSNSRGICYDKYISQDLPAQLSFPGTSSTSSWTYTMPAECKYVGEKSDTRFNLLDHTDIESFLASNFEDLVNYCSNSGVTLYAKSDGRYSSANDPDFYSSGVYSSSSSRSKYTAEWSDLGYSSAPACASGDAICSSVLYQTACGKWSHAAHIFFGESTTIGLYTMSQIYWNSDTCTSEQNIYNSRVMLKSAVASQLAVLIINWLAFIFSLKTLSSRWRLITEVADFSKSGDTLNQETRLAQMQYLDILALVVKAIPIIVSFSILCSLYRTWKTFNSANCSDTMTNYTFAYLEERIPAIWGNALATFVIDLGLLFEALRKLRKIINSRNRARLNMFVDEHGIEFYHATVPPRRKQTGGYCCALRGAHLHCFAHDYDFPIAKDLLEGDHIFIYEDGHVLSKPRGIRSRDEWIAHCTGGGGSQSMQQHSQGWQHMALPMATVAPYTPSAAELHSNTAIQSASIPNLYTPVSQSPAPSQTALYAPGPLVAAAQDLHERVAYAPSAPSSGQSAGQSRALEIDVQAGWTGGQLIKVVDPVTGQALDVQLPAEVHLGQRIRVPVPVAQPRRFLEVQVIAGMKGGQHIMVMNPDTRQPIEVVLPAVINQGDKIHVPF